MSIELKIEPHHSLYQARVKGLLAGRQRMAVIIAEEPTARATVDQAILALDRLIKQAEALRSELCNMASLESIDQITCVVEDQ